MSQREVFRRLKDSGILNKSILKKSCLKRVLSLRPWSVTSNDGNCKGNAYSICMGQTIFGLTSTTGTSYIKYVGFLKSIKDIPDSVDIFYKDSDIDPDCIVDIFTLDGKCVCKGIVFSAARDSLPHGIYIIGGKKIIF